MSTGMDQVIAVLEKGIPRRGLRTAVDGRRLIVELEPAEIKPAIAALLAAGAVRFATLTAADAGTDIDVLYTLEVGGRLLTLRTALPKEASKTDSIADLMPAAEMGEKEASELFGIAFAGHPRLQNLILPSDWPAEKQPLRGPMTGNVFPQARMTVENLLRDATSIRVAPSSMTRREAAGLPKQPAIASVSAQSMQEFVELVKRTGFDRRAGYDWAKRRLRYK